MEKLLLIIGKNAIFRRAMDKLFSRKNIITFTSAEIGNAVQTLRNNPIDYVLIESGMLNDDIVDKLYCDFPKVKKFFWLGYNGFPNEKILPIEHVDEMYSHVLL